MNTQEKKLLGVLRSLPEAQQQSLLDYAEFLASRTSEFAVETKPGLELLLIERPAQESVIKAVRRLMKTYPMLDSTKLLNETSGFVTQHVLHGKPAVEVIDEMEIFFSRHYEEFKAAK